MRFYFSYVKTATPLKKSPPLSQQPPLKIEILSSPPFWKFGRSLNPPRGGGGGWGDGGVNTMQQYPLVLHSLVNRGIGFHDIFEEQLYFVLAGRNCRISTWETLQAKSHDTWCPSGHWCSCKGCCWRHGKTWLAFEHSFCY